MVGNRKNALHDIFIIGLIIKAIDGILELAGGIILTFFYSGSIVSLVQNTFRHELAQDPTDIIANLIIPITQHISLNMITFAAIYLFFHGLIKIILVVLLWLKKRWAYPLAGTLIVLFLIYQIIKFVDTHSLILLFLISVDITLLALLGSEYKRFIKDRS